VLVQLISVIFYRLY